MKIKIAYQEHETIQAEKVMAIVRTMMPEAETKVTRSDKHEPFRHIYLTTKQRRKNTEKA